MTLNPYQAVMVLNVYNNGDYYDVKGTYIRPGKGINKDKVQVEINTVKLHFPESQLIEYNHYWDVINKRAEDDLPSLATRKHHFATYEGY